MFKKNLYSFCALLALSSSAYAMEGLNEEGSAPSTSTRSPLRTSNMGESNEDGPAPSISVSSPPTSICALLALSSSIYAMEGLNDDGSAPSTSVSSPASSVPNSLFSDNDAKAAFTWPGLLIAVERDEPRAKHLLAFFAKKYPSVEWDPNVVYELPILQKELDNVDLWDFLRTKDAWMIRDVNFAILSAPTRALMMQLSKALNCPPPEFSSHGGMTMGLEELALKADARLKDLEAALETQRAKSQRLEDALQAIREGVWPDGSVS